MKLNKTKVTLVGFSRMLGLIRLGFGFISFGLRTVIYLVCDEFWIMWVLFQMITYQPNEGSITDDTKTESEEFGDK